MTMRRLVAVLLAIGMSVLPQMLIAQSLGGHSSRNGPEYEVRIQNTVTGQIVATVPLDSDTNNFIVSQLAIPGDYLVVLFDRARMAVVCTEGPFALTGPNSAGSSKLDVEIDCGTPAAWLWLAALAGGVGLAGAIAVQSDTR